MATNGKLINNLKIQAEESSQIKRSEVQKKSKGIQILKFLDMSNRIFFKNEIKRGDVKQTLMIYWPQNWPRIEKRQEFSD